MTKEQPDNEVADLISAHALEWFTQLKKYLSIAYRDECRMLAKDAKPSEMRQAAARAMVASLLESGMDRSDLIESIGGSLFSETHSTGSWTDELNDRRFELIDKDIQGDISIEEQFELSALTALMRRSIDSAEYLPTEGAKLLHEKLLELEGND